MNFPIEGIEFIDINPLMMDMKIYNEIIDKFNYYEKLITIGNVKESMIKIDYLKDLSINLSNIGYTPIDFAKYLSIESITSYIKGVISVASGIFDIFVTVIISIYILRERDEIMENSKKVRR